MTRNEFLQRFLYTTQDYNEPDYPLTRAPQKAAVLIPLQEDDGILNVIFTQRAQHLRHHPGQISFPGGRLEATDKSLKHAALRESFEEIGLASDNVDVVGHLKSYKTISGFEIFPHVGFVRRPFQVIRDPNEVDNVFTVPIRVLLQRDNYLVHTVSRNGVSFPVYFFAWKGRLIWGATAAIMRNLSVNLA